MAMYRFQRNRKVEQPAPGFSRRRAILRQCIKCQEELNEIVAAVKDGERDGRILEECADLVQAVEGIQRMFSYEQVRCSYGVVARKCRDRGDYEA